MWMKNTEGKPDAVLTLAALSIFGVLFRVVFGGFHLAAGGVDISLPAIDAAVIGSLLTPTLGAYVARRYTDRRYPSDVEPPAPEGKE